jgi:hypothetical protein
VRDVADGQVEPQQRDERPAQPSADSERAEVVHREHRPATWQDEREVVDVAGDVQHTWSSAHSERIAQVHQPREEPRARPRTDVRHRRDVVRQVRGDRHEHGLD